MIFHPKAESFRVFVDADFSGNWSKDSAEWDTDTARSRSGFVITYAGCPIYWGSKMQTEIALSTTEAEYITASESLRHALHLMALITELKQRHFPVHTQTTTVHTRLYEDNSGAIELLKVAKLRPRTKHLNIKYHHFRSAIIDSRITVQPPPEGTISVHKIETECQPADMLTKSLSPPLFKKHRLYINGW